MKIRGNQGFTIIELIVVIIILGILAAVALPRFMDATERAHDASVMGAKGALAEAVQMVKAQWYVNGNSNGDAESNLNGFGNGLVDVNTNGWPVTTDLAVTSEFTGPGSINCRLIWEGLLNEGSIAVTSSATTEVGGYDGYITGAPQSGVCKYDYANDLGGGDTSIFTSLRAGTAAGTNDNRSIRYDTTTGKVQHNVDMAPEEGN